MLVSNRPISLEGVKILPIERDGYIYHPLLEADIEDAAHIVSSSFATMEPLSVLLKIPKSSIFDLCKSFLSQTIKDNLSVVCKDEKGHIVGALLSKDLKTEVNFADLDPAFDPIFALIEMLISKHFTSDRLLLLPRHEGAEFFMIGTQSSVLVKGVGRNLIRISSALLNHLGYKFSVTEATSPIMQSIGVQFGLLPVAFVDYEDFQYKGEKIFKDTSFDHYKTSKKLFADGKAGAALLIGNSKKCLKV